MGVLVFACGLFLLWFDCYYILCLWVMLFVFVDVCLRFSFLLCSVILLPFVCRNCLLFTIWLFVLMDCTLIGALLFIVYVWFDLLCWWLFVGDYSLYGLVLVDICYFSVDVIYVAFLFGWLLFALLLIVSCSGVLAFGGLLCSRLVCYILELRVYGYLIFYLVDCLAWIGGLIVMFGVV